VEKVWVETTKNCSAGRGIIRYENSIRRDVLVTASEHTNLMKLFRMQDAL
jgi:hypothetical protein